MNKIEDGGPAFPHDNQELGDRHRVAQPGMSLRDYFAGQALAGTNPDEWPTAEKLAAYMYRVADAMLAAREAK